MIKAVIFDLDGTLLDTHLDILNAINHSLELLNLKHKSPSDVKKALGYGVDYLVNEILKKDCDQPKIEYFKKSYQDYYNQNQFVFTKPYDSINLLLRKLKDLGYKIAIVTNKLDYLAKDIVKKMFIETFDFIVGAKEGLLLKPSPMMPFLALKELGVFSHEALYVGDTEVDLLTANNALLKSIMVTWGFRTKEEIIKLNSDYIVNSPLEILEIVASLNNKKEEERNGTY